MKNRSENSAGRGQILSILQVNSHSIDQKSGEIWTGQADLQPISFKSDRLLGKGKGYRGVSVERGLGGASPGSAPSYIAMCHYLFDTADDFMAAFMPHAAELQGDMPNYTDIDAIIQVSEVAISR